VKHIPVLQEMVKQRSEQVKSLQECQAKDSHKSSLPPSSDRFARQKKDGACARRVERRVEGRLGTQGTRFR